MRWDEPYPEYVGKMRDDQVAQRSEWQRTGWDVAPEGIVTRVRVVPAGSSTVTHVNVMEPASIGDDERGYMDPGGDCGAFIPAGRP